MISETTSAEIMMHTVRLMRSEKFRTAEAIKRALSEDFPDVTPDDLQKVLSELATRLWRDA